MTEPISPGCDPLALVIDDDDLVRATVAAMLETAGYTVLRARDGDAGLILFDEHQPELVVTDVLMPGLRPFWNSAGETPWSGSLQ